MAKNKYDEIREGIDPKDMSSIVVALNLLIDELENVVGKKRPLNNPKQIKAPAIDDGVRTVVK